jgi:hypothetical protein
LCSTNVSKFLSKFWLIQKGYSTVSKSREFDKTTAIDLGYFHCDKVNKVIKNRKTSKNNLTASALSTKHSSKMSESLLGYAPVDLLFNWFGISCMTTDNFCFYMQNRLIQTSQTGGQWYSDTSPFSIPCLSI